MYNEGVTVMTISEARAALPEVLNRVAEGEEVTITRHGRPIAVVIRPDVIWQSGADVPLGNADVLVAALRDQLAAKYPVIDIDGARADFGDGWALVRNSNTSPALTIRCEARSPEGLVRICSEVHDLLAAQPSVDMQAWPKDVAGGH